MATSSPTKPTKSSTPSKDGQEKVPHNLLTNYSNGMTMFTRYFPALAEPTTLSIPVKKRHIADMIATIAALGDVRVMKPASYTAQENSQTLTLDPKNVQRDMVQKFSGAVVEIVEKSGKGHKGRLAGSERYSRITDDGIVEGYRIGLYTEGGEFKSFLDEQITGIKIACPQLQSQINKALDRNFREINPESAYVDMTVAPLANAEKKPFAVQWTIPTSAWQSVYHLRIKGKKCRLEYAAKIDNPTDDEIKDTIVSVVVGDPISFPTTLEDIITPRRRKVSLVNEDAVGQVQQDEEADFDDAEGVFESVGGSRRGVQLQAMSFGGPAAASARGIPSSSSSSSSKSLASTSSLDRAEMGGSDAKEVGDFAIFTAETPMDIGANRSGIIPLLSVEVEDHQPILLYKESADKRRPFRAIRFKNNLKDRKGTPVSLGLGVCTVYIDGEFAGQDLMQPKKPEEYGILVHARENGVKVVKNPPNIKGGCTIRRFSKIVLSGGTALMEEVLTHETDYVAKNGRNEDFSLEIEHRQVLTGSECKIEGSSARHTTLENGVRIPVALKANAQALATVKETLVQSHTYAITGETGAAWVDQNIICIEGTGLDKNEKLQAVIKLRGQIIEKRKQVQQNERKITSLKDEYSRLLNMIQTLKEGTEVNTYRGDSDKAHREIMKIERETIPGLHKSIEEDQKHLDAAMLNLSVSWEEKPVQTKV